MSKYAPYRDEIVARLLAGQGVRYIARAIGCSPTAVMNQRRRLRIGVRDPDDPGVALPTGTGTPLHNDPGVGQDQPDVNEALAAGDQDRARGLRLLWQIATDPGATPAARVQAIDKLGQMNSWDFVQQQRVLPAPLSYDAQIERLLVLLSTYPDTVLSRVLTRLGWSPPAKQDAENPGQHQAQHA